MAERLRRDELGLADDPVQAGVLLGEVEERAEAEQLRLEPRLPPRRRLLHGLANAVVQVAHELGEDLLLRREVEIEGALADAGPLGDLHDRRLRVADVGEDLLRRLEQAPPRLHALARERAAAGAGDDLRHRESTSSRSSCFCALPMPLRGISATKRNDFGTLKRARRSRPQRASSSPAAASATPKATPTSP